MILDWWNPMLRKAVMILERVVVRQLTTATVVIILCMRVCHAPMKSARQLSRHLQRSVALRLEVYKLREKVNRLSFNQDTFKDNDDIVHDLTGLPSFPKLMVVFAFVSEFLKGGSGLSPFQCFVMTQMRMRLNLPLHFLSYIFHVPKRSAGRIFNSTLNTLHHRLPGFVWWPTKDQIQISLPMCFQNSQYRNCTSIIDCFEIFIERPKNLKARAQTYSQYKHHNTAKFLISITPQGVISCHVMASK